MHEPKVTSILHGPMLAHRVRTNSTQNHFYSGEVTFEKASKQSKPSVADYAEVDDAGSNAILRENIKRLRSMQMNKLKQQKNHR